MIDFAWDAMGRIGGLKIRRRGDAWQMDSHHGGRRVRRLLRSKGAAESAGRQMQQDARRHGHDAFALDPAQRADAAQALAMLPGGVSLVAAAKAWMASNQRGPSPSIATATAGWLEAKRAGGRRAKTLNDYRVYAAGMVERWGPLRVDDVRRSDVEEWFAARGWQAVAWKNARANLSAFFGWARRRGYCAANPTADMDPPRWDVEPVRILTADESATLLDTAARIAPRMVPYYAMGLFAGIRPAELQRLDLAAVSGGYIRIGSGVAKTRQQRLVDVRPALAAWLAVCQPAGRVHWSRRAHRRVVTVAGLEWSQDVMRHTFASMLLAETGDPVRTAGQMGHVGVNVLMDHYRALVTPEEAARFWAIRP